MSKLRLVYKDAKSNKFWEIESIGSTINIVYGKVGTNGQTIVKKTKGPNAAYAEVQKLIKSKLKKGYKKK
tara:strand:- start:461 stop:670 length:210 start_codon:yes stop_codon:yes gene_type:complete